MSTTNFTESELTDIRKKTATTIIDHGKEINWQTRLEQVPEKPRQRSTTWLDPVLSAIAKDQNAVSSELKSHGLDHVPLPNEKQFHSDLCPFLCGKEVFYLNRNSTNISPTDSFTIAYNKDQSSEHICELGSTQLNNIIRYLFNENRALRQQILDTQRTTKNMVNMSAMVR